MSVVQPPIDELLERTDSRFTLSVLAAKRARNITDLITGIIGPKALEDVKVSNLTRVTKAKPLSIALDEVHDGDVMAVAPQSFVAEVEGDAEGAAPDGEESLAE